jgi:hypothetical protein
MSTLTESTDAAPTEGERPPAEELRGTDPGEQHDETNVRSLLPILVGSLAVGIAAVAIIGVQLGRRRKSRTPLRRVAARAEDAKDALASAAEDAKDALTSAAAGLPDRGKAALRRVRR